MISIGLSVASLSMNMLGRPHGVLLWSIDVIEWDSSNQVLWGAE